MLGRVQLATPVAAQCYDGQGCLCSSQLSSSIEAAARTSSGGDVRTRLLRVIDWSR